MFLFLIVGAITKFAKFYFQRAIGFYVGIAFYYINNAVTLTPVNANRIIIACSITFIIHNAIIGVTGVVHPELIDFMKPINFSIAGIEFGLFALGC